MTIHILNRRLTLTSTYHVKRRPNRRTEVAAFERALRVGSMVLAGIAVATISVVGALAQIAGAL